ncbi:MAG: hypothetical protein ABR969_00755 [Sedimentisphaerales bacterium]
MRSFITASMIEQRLCSSRDGQELLPQLVEKLITASVPKEAIREFRFPHGDQIYLHGADGILAVDDNIQNPYVPSGISVWEMGTSIDPKSKADKDFDNAKDKLAQAFPNVIPAVTPDKATFIFVTSKPWESGEWIKEKRRTSDWKSIKVIDAVDLEKWLEQYPAVMLWFADVCGLPAEGLYDAEQYLRKIGISFGISDISPELIMAGRDENMKCLDNLVTQSNAKIYVRGESIEEAAAFLAASSLKEADLYGKIPPLIFADSQADLNLLATAGAEATMIPIDSEALARIEGIVGHKWRLVVPEVESFVSSDKGKGLILSRCKRPAIEQYLIEKMKIPEHRAKQITRDTKGSLIALLWLIGSGPKGVPRWASRKDATTHASLMLAGSWIGNNGNDTKIIERLSRQTYRDIETLLQSAEIPEGPWIHRGVEWLCASRDFVWSQLIGRVTETMLSDFHGIVREVVGEKDPSLELAPSDRHMANILGKTRKYSSLLRRGLVDSVARLAIFKPDGQTWADKIVRDILDPTGTEVLNRWLSLTDVYSEIAEASPDVFLESLDEFLQLDDAKQLFQDTENYDAVFGPTSAHVYLLWALERLAWQKEYFSHVLSVLIKLAEIDTGGKICNRPKNSLVTILLPWSPQHSETMHNAAQAVKMLYSISPKITWEVSIGLLPTSHGVTSPTPTPTYRKHPGKREVTGDEYWEFIREVIEMMIQWAEKNAFRWASLVKAYPEIRRGYPELGQLITDALKQVKIEVLDDGDKAGIYNAMRDVIFHHREFPEAEWALPDSDLKLLESMSECFKPQDGVLLHKHLFSWNPNITDAPMKPYENGWDEWISEKRMQAVKLIYDQGGLSDVFRLCESVVLADAVGYATAKLQLLESETAQLLQRGLSEIPSGYPKKSITQMARAYVWCKYKEEGDKWLEGILARSDITWTPGAYANLALALPASPDLWKRLQLWGKDVENLYWRNIEIFGDVREHWLQILDKWAEVKRPWSSIELIWRVVDKHRSDSTDKVLVERVMTILDKALQVDEDVEPLGRNQTMLSYYIEHLFLFLDTQNIEPGQMAHLEWGWLRVLEHTKRGVKVLHMQIITSPELFVDLLKVVYRAEGEQRNTDISDVEKKIAEQAYNLLRDIRTIPGSKSDKTVEGIDSSALHEWVLKARKLAKDIGRLRVCDSQIGQILSYAPSSPDGSWPCVEVRNLIEEIQSSVLENGFQIGKYNQRGAIFRGKDGKQDWDLAKNYKELADKVRIRWPRTASILDGLTKTYENEAKHWDERAKRDEYEY